MREAALILWQGFLRILMAAAIVMCCAASGVARGQEVTATLVGQVTDGAGAVLPGALVVVTDTDTRQKVRTVVADGRGEFTATLLPVGTYSVRVTVPGFKALVQAGIELHVGDRLSLPLALRPGEVQEQVTVNANALSVQTQTAASDELISGEEIRELSINNRNFLGLLQILPGVTNTAASDELTIGAVNPTGSVNSLGFSLNGGRVSANSFLLDGADNLDRGANTTLINTPSVDAIQEFKVIRGVYSAQYGRNAASQVNVITRSGESTFHGVAYEFFRNDILDANNALLNYKGIARPPLRYNDFGYTLGGPVFLPNHYNASRDKTFFFFSEEFRRVVQYPTPSQPALVPTAAMKMGVFAHPVCTNYSMTAPAGTVCLTNSTTITTIDPVAAEYIKDVFDAIPAGDPTSYELLTVGRAVYNLHQELARIDQVINARETLTVRYIADTANTVEPYGYQVNGLLPGVSTTKTQSPGTNAMVRLTSVLRPSMLNEIAFAFTTGRKYSIPDGLLAKSNATDVQVNLPFQSTVQNVPYISFSGLSAAKGYGTYDNHSRNYNAFDDLTWVLGEHTLKFGATYNYYQKTENNASTNAGQFAFPETTPPATVKGSTPTTQEEQSWANFLLGKQATFTQTSLDLVPDIRQNEAEAYVQDDYRLTSRLTVNAGLRYSMFRMPYDDRHMLSNFDPALYVAGNAPTLANNGTTIVAGTGDTLNGIIVNNATSPYGSKVSNEPGGRFAPRAGFALSPMRDGKLVVRGGYGLVFDSTLVGIYENNVFSNPPYLVNLSVNNTTFANPAAGLAATSIGSLHGTPLPATLPYAQQYSFDVQKEIGTSFLMDAGYYGSKGTHLLGIVDNNELAPGVYHAATGSVAPLTTGTAGLANQYRPFKGYTSINTVENSFGSNYNSLQVSAEKRMGNGSILRLAYTFQKTLTDASTDRNSAPQDRTNYHVEYAVANFNRSQILVLSYVYKIPFPYAEHRIAHKLLFGWELSGTTSFDAGLATEVLSGSGQDTAQLGVEGSSSVVALRPDKVGNANANAPHTLGLWFNPAAYKDVPSGQVRLGTAGATSMVGPGFQQWDISLFRNMAITERVHFQLRCESFNAFNHTNPQGLFTTTDVTTLGSSFGAVASVREPRRIQIGAKILF